MQWLKKWMEGRYFRSDTLSTTLVVVAMLLGITSILTHFPLLNILADILLIYFIFRSFSKRIDRRIMENTVFVRFFSQLFRKIGKPFQDLCCRFRDRKTHIYLKCPGCKQNLRLPRGKGKLKVTCPKCKTEFYKTT